MSGFDWTKEKTSDTESIDEGEIPEYYGQTIEAFGHGLTAIEGQLVDLKWRCRFCGEIAHDTTAFEGVECT